MLFVQEIVQTRRIWLYCWHVQSQDCDFVVCDTNITFVNTQSKHPICSYRDRGRGGAPRNTVFQSKQARKHKRLKAVSHAPSSKCGALSALTVLYSVTLAEGSALGRLGVGVPGLVQLPGQGFPITLLSPSLSSPYLLWTWRIFPLPVFASAQSSHSCLAASSS